MLRAQLIDSTTIRLDRSLGSDDLEEIAWQVVELRDGSLVQRGNTSFGVAAQAVVPLGYAVDTTRSIAFASVQPVGGQNLGRSDFGGDDVIGVCSVTMALASNQITMDRSSTAGSCDVGWFAVQFANAPTAVDLVSFTASRRPDRKSTTLDSTSTGPRLGKGLMNGLQPDRFPVWAPRRREPVTAIEIRL
jgi:hypothetical protein